MCWWLERNNKTRGVLKVLDPCNCYIIISLVKYRVMVAFNVTAGSELRQVGLDLYFADFARTFRNWTNKNFLTTISIVVNET